MAVCTSILIEAEGLLTVGVDQFSEDFLEAGARLHDALLEFLADALFGAGAVLTEYQQAGGDVLILLTTYGHHTVVFLVVTLIDFSVVVSGLIDQLITDIVDVNVESFNFGTNGSNGRRNNAVSFFGVVFQQLVKSADRSFDLLVYRSDRLLITLIQCLEGIHNLGGDVERQQGHQY